MRHITIKSLKNSDDNFKKILKQNILNSINERMGSNRNTLDNLDPVYRNESIHDAITTIRVSFDTKNKLKKYLKPRETYEEVIRRLMENNEQLREESSFLKSLEKQNKSLIKYIESGFKREQKTFIYHPDLKIEYSYNDSKAKSHDEFSFNLEIDNYLLQGKPVSEEKGIRTIQTIDILKSLKNINLNSDPKEIIREKEFLLESNVDYIKTKYFVYFKILHFIINKKLDKKINESNYFNLDFWKDRYDSHNISNNSLNEDVVQKLNKFELELEQIKINKERSIWTIRSRR
ncbi:MAG: hypothetical protein ABIG84_03595 [archaeon]